MTINECRQLLGDTQMTDTEISQLLHAIHRINVKVLDEYFADDLSDDDV
ncbi:MAG: hypothetical protein PHZ00_04930 [Candidatus Peribacteraceae bacterium]|nr:hypothetical protein [Candidatus Peribacteraceae bacterium]